MVKFGKHRGKFRVFGVFKKRKWKNIYPKLPRLPRLKKEL